MKEEDNQIKHVQERMKKTSVKLNLLNVEILKKEYNEASKNKIRSKIQSLEARIKRKEYKIASLEACKKAKELDFVEDLVFDYKKTKQGKFLIKERVPMILYYRAILKDEPMKYYSQPINVKLETIRKKYFPDGGDKDKAKISVLDKRTGEEITFERDH